MGVLLCLVQQLGTRTPENYDDKVKEGCTRHHMVHRYLLLGATSGGLPLGVFRGWCLVEGRIPGIVSDAGAFGPASHHNGLLCRPKLAASGPTLGPLPDCSSVKHWVG
jgi:hypothetical protein